MRRSSLLKPCLGGARWCASCTAALLLWTVWLLLAIGIYLQLHIGWSHELSLPGWVRTRIADRLAESGLRAEFGNTVFDLSGRILIEDIAIYSPSVSDPLARVKAIELHVDPWAALARSYVPYRQHVSGLTLYTPAMFSPSGRTEPILSNLELFAAPDGRLLHIDQANARVGALTVSLEGDLLLPRGRRDPTAVAAAIAAGVQRYLQLSRTLVDAERRLDILSEPALHIRLTPDETHVALAEVTLLANAVRVPDLGPADRTGTLSTGPIRLRTTAPLLNAPSMATRLVADIASPRWGERLLAGDVRLVAEGQLRRSPFAFTPQSVLLTSPELTMDGWTLRHLNLRATTDGLPRLAVDVLTEFAGATWAARASGDYTTHSGELALEGVLTPELLRLVEAKAQRGLTKLLQYEHGARFAATASFQNGTVTAVNGRAAIGAVVARRVALDEASAIFSYDGKRLLFDEITLRIGPSLARGSYEMDVKTLDYRFLLDGHLHPPAIGGWFQDWWPRFWSNITFTGALPNASVDVLGRWGAPHLSSVFVMAEGPDASLKTSPFDHIYTRLFIRPAWYDGLDFHVVKAGREARGSFARSVNLDKNEWASMEFDLVSTLALPEAARIFGQPGLDLVAPYDIKTAPTLRLKGRLDGPGSPSGEHQAIDVRIQSTGPFAYYGFPLSDLAVDAHVQDDATTLENLSVVFAGGRTEGRVQVTGRGTDRRLAFDLNLRNARLGDAITTLENYGAARKQAAPEPAKFQQRAAAGLLDISLSAEGPFNDTTGFKGEGSASLSGATLTEINLLGLLSQVLRSAGIGFTTLRLDEAHANFKVDGPTLRFSELAITGPSAAIQAKGNYHLPSKTMDFLATVRPFEQSDSLLGSAVGLVLAPISKVLELRLNGTLESPSWVFAYGPTNFLRAITGSQPRVPGPTPPPPPPAPSGSEPPPYLRRNRP